MDMKKRFLHLFSLMLAVLMLIPCVGSAEEAEAVDNGVMREGLTALEATRLMGNGINLGNTLEACDNNVGIKTNTPLSYETHWGQPKTTQAMIDGMKAAGFDTIRIPVTWYRYTSDDGTYTIREDFLHQNSFHEIDTYTSLEKQHNMMRLVLAFYDAGLDALKQGADINDIVKLPVREQIGRYKYTKEDQLAAEYEKVTRQLAAETAELLGKEGL
jgi:hypothetical protein